MQIIKTITEKFMNKTTAPIEVKAPTIMEVKKIEIEEPIADMKAYFKLWKEITADKAKLSSSYFLIHDLILGRDPKKSAFTPITNKNKLMNGQTRWQGLSVATMHVHRYLKNDPLARQLIELSGNSVEAIAEKAGKINLVD
jgi:hypothetical protein